MNIIEQLNKTKAASYGLAFISDRERNDVLHSLARNLHCSIVKILEENSKDLMNMTSNNPMYDRLVLTEGRIKEMVEDIDHVISLPSPLSEKMKHKVMPNGLIIKKIPVPLGVVAVIYESRPNVTIDVFTLCFKAGNACVLKGGKEAYHTNLILCKLIQKALEEHAIDLNALYLFPANRDDTNILLNATGLVDVCIPRGSQSLINFVRNNAKIPVIETGAGIVHAYFDLSGDIIKGRNIINNAKTRRVSVCNALDCLLIHKACMNDIFALVEPLQHHTVEIFADQKAYGCLEALYPQNLLHLAGQTDFGREFLSYKLAIKTVDSVDDALEHIRAYTSNHSETIITEDKKVAKYFVERIDAAAVYVNASTAFTDGGQFGMGAEIGVSTQKLHARGPMGLDALTSYKWVIYGDGQVRV